MEARIGETFGIGFLIGYIFSLVVVVVIFMPYCMPREHAVKKRNRVMKTPMMTSLMERREKRREEAILEISKLEESVTRLSFRMLYDATDSFCQDNVVGVGKMGTMYKGMLPSGCFIAVKRLNESQYLEKGFISQLIILSRLRHINMVPFLGFCIESRERLLLCYKYISNGKLYDWLHPVEGGASFLEWPTRTFIAMKVAKGLIYLHNNCQFPTAHLNLSSSCILLDKNFEPKISNFGGAVFISKNSRNFFENVLKQDVYRFGILLLELITGEDPVRNNESFHSLKQTLVEQNAHHSTSSFSSLCHVVDVSLIGQGFDLEILHCLRVACGCLQTLPDQRPTMTEVYNELLVFKILGVGHITACRNADGTELEMPRCSETVHLQL
ncbi:probably inactive leucine-rich repeat receptor-like protein kinase At5g48380 [Ricinus communis]|uniref:probably inactive leucine-rich repeat receptor-like protein kinase At5g48380 n=1 Tax=Ricinus communis TaxID=3988 RepID=UPI00201A8D99|nr:probably inactive leucine-rich repeat receptor-like protein kinase At5g48380 [Ricinus communis]